MYSTISIEELEKLVTKSSPAILDVRPSEQFKEEHIPSARSLPLEQLVVSGIPSDLDKTISYHIICRSGVKSQKASALLTEAGYTAINTDKGMNDWKGPVTN
ncbi:MAG: rhodanese-like domain-containing protein [Lactobacillales bacterium]|jgi:rhodanese-related sulfurtransferase|nr:rhodanese-like domain-containing protein [Lactobacillales bacterium]